jgi:hypothetical protein
MKNCATLIAILLFFWIPILSHAQTEPREKPTDAYIRILNCCDTDQAERWRTGLDLKFKDNYIGRDIRIARQGPLGKISFVGKDTIEVFRTGGTQDPIAKIPASLKAGGFYTILVLGNLGASASDVQVKLVEEYPIPEDTIPPGMVRMQLVNAVKNFPAAIRIKSTSGNPSPKWAELSQYLLPPGELEMDLVYRDSGGKVVTVPWVVEISADEDYVGVIHPSRDRSDIPSFLRINVAASRNEILTPPQEDALQKP